MLYYFRGVFEEWLFVMLFARVSLLLDPLPRGGVMACVRVTFRLCFVSKSSENSVYALIV